MENVFYEDYDDSLDVYDPLSDQSVPYYVEESQGFLDFFTSSSSYIDLWDHCILLSLKDALKIILPICSFCFLTNFISILGEYSSNFIHWSATVMGLMCVYHVFQNNIIHTVLFAVLVFVYFQFIVHLVKKFYGPAIAFICLLYLIISEFVVERKIWHQVRGAQMLIAMKVISVGFDIDKGVLTSVPTFPEFFGYCFLSGTVIFGPWISFSNYQRILRPKHWGFKNWQWILKLSVSFVLALICLLLSSCISHWIITENANRWLLSYRDAFSFRFSHYFVSFLSEVTLLASGWGLVGHVSEKKTVSVAQPYHVELPRSLVEVVIHWNLPMHYWLKTYIFKTARPLGKFLAILCTYGTSSLLHGLNFQLAAVLLSLGIYSYTEHVLRLKLATIFSACILARKCKISCDHHHKESHPFVKLVNLGFGLLSVFHLAYLGLMFDDVYLEEEGYNMKHTLRKWSELSFCSHWVVAAMYGFYLLI